MAPSAFVRRHGLEAFRRRFERAEREAKAFAEAYRGKLAELADRLDAGETLAESVKAYESLQDLTGRIMAYASLLYASDTSDPQSRNSTGTRRSV